MRVRNIKGERFGRFIVLERAPNRRLSSGQSVVFWKCRCDCGQIKEVRGTNLCNGNSKSCGCFHREEAARRVRERFINSPKHSRVLWYYKRNAKTRGVKWNLSKEEFFKLIQEDCYFCGTSPPLRPGPHNLRYNGLDRIDNSGGYELENVVACCTTCNSAKSTMPVLEFAEWVERIHQRLNQWIET